MVAGSHQPSDPSPLVTPLLFPPPRDALDRMWTWVGRPDIEQCYCVLPSLNELCSLKIAACASSFSSPDYSHPINFPFCLPEMQARVATIRIWRTFHGSLIDQDQPLLNRTSIFRTSSHGRPSHLGVSRHSQLWTVVLWYQMSDSRFEDTKWNHSWASERATWTNFSEMDKTD